MSGTSAGMGVGCKSIVKALTHYVYGELNQR